MLALLLLVLAGCSERTDAVPPLAPLEAVQAGGVGIRALSRAAVVEYTPDRYFGIAFLVENQGDRPVTIVRLLPTDTGRRFARLVGVRVVSFTPRNCVHSCPAPSLGLDAPFRELGPLRAVTVQPHRTVSVVLHFRWVACNSAPQSTAQSENRQLRVEYRIDGHTGLQLLSTGRARLSVKSAGCS